MNTKARRSSDTLVRVVAALAVFSLSGGVAAAYQVGVRAKRPPSFTVGGEFDAGRFPAPGVNGRGYPYGNVLQNLGPSAVPAGAAGPVATPGAGTGTGTVTPTTLPATTPLPFDLLATPRPPAVGTYTYAVKGSEGATGFGGRGFPAQATVVVHGDPSVQADELVHDLELSDQHEERTIIRYGPTGLAFTYEGGTITFGPGTQTSQGFYAPPMTQIPFPLTATASAGATSPVTSPGGAVSRTEVWAAKVVGQETIEVLGQPRATWVIDLQRKTTPGGPEQVDRFRRYWFDPEVGTWVKWTERFHAARNLVVAFTYDAEYTATLTSFTPA